MTGIDLNRPVFYKGASFRFFGANEEHITRQCGDNVLLLVFAGVLRFSEDGEKYEVQPGEYHIQKQNTYQTGGRVSDSPKYLYVHFLADWAENEWVLPRRGTFSCERLMPFMEEIHHMAHGEYTAVERTAKFLELLSILYRERGRTELTAANRMAAYLAEHTHRAVSLDELAQEFNYSKNHVINLFKKEYHKTPIEYMNLLRLRQAEQLLEVTSMPVEKICYECGFREYSHFYKLFYREKQMSPREWRSQRRIQSS